MKILVVSHRFPPRHQTGAELYAYRLASELARRHDVWVLSADEGLRNRNHSRRDYTVDDLRVTELTNHRQYDEFEHTYADPKMESEFRKLLAEAEPDIIHFQHLLHHSTSYPEIARENDVPSVMTLHEYWLICGRNGQFVQDDGTRCETPGLEKCSRCLSTFMWGRRGFDVWALRGLAGVKRLTGLDLKGRARELRLRRGKAAEVPSDVVDSMKSDVLFREARVRDMLDMVDCFIAPSEFLRRRFIEFGLDETRILHSDYGTCVESFVAAEPKPSDGRLRVGFLGSIQPVKGVHVLVQALQDLDDADYVARIYGDLGTKPEYVDTLRRQLTDSTHLMGAIEAHRVPEALADLDVLVVPSTWWENSPLVIHEAFAARVPVICSGIGGMAELVADEVSGLHFPPGDSVALGNCLRRLVDDPELLLRLRTGVPELKTIAKDARFHESLYGAIIEHHAEVAAQQTEAEFFGSDEAG